MNYHKIEKTSIVNGEGIRVVLWCSGCGIHCKGCHNPETWDFNSGKPFDEQEKQELLKAVDKPYIQGITLSGGHPLEYDNIPDVYEIIKCIKDKFPEKDIWLYTGYTLNIRDFNTLIHHEPEWDIGAVLELCDVVVDGPYVEELRDITLRFRGSSNQRLIDVKKTIESKEIVLWNEVS